jgi:hypothetical protein
LKESENTTLLFIGISRKRGSSFMEALSAEEKNALSDARFEKVGEIATA